MVLFSWLLRKKKPVPEPPVRLSLVVIDIPNIVNAANDPKHIYTLARNWPSKLREHIDQNTQGRVSIGKLAFSSLTPSTSHLKFRLKGYREDWEKAGYKFINYDHEDTDTIFAIDLMGAVMRAMEQYATAHLRLVIVSGDGAFVRPPIHIKEAYAKRLTLETYVCAWGTAISKKFSRIVPSDRIQHLERVPGMVA